MAKLFASDSDIWNGILQAWNDMDFYETVSKAYDMTGEINTILTSNGFSGISRPEITAVSDLRIKYRLFLAFCEKIHQKAEAEIDEPFYYAMSKAAGEAFRINPTEIKVGAVSAGGRDLSVLQLVSMAVGLDKELKAAFDTAVATLKQREPSKELQSVIVETLMRKYAGATKSTQMDTADIDLLLHYYQMQYPKDVHSFQNFLNIFNVQGAYASEMDVINAVAGEMRSRTDKLNLEHSVTITVINAFGKDYYLASEIVAGQHGNVVLAAILNSPLLGKSSNLFSNRILVHTHPSVTYEDNTFSGTPGSINIFGGAEKVGDATVVDRLGYDSIYLIGIDGKLFKYEGKGTGYYMAEDKKGMNDLARNPFEDLTLNTIPQAEVVYIWNPATEKYEIPVYK